MGIKKYFTVFVVIAGITFVVKSLSGPYITTTFRYGIMAARTPLSPPAYKVSDVSQTESKPTLRVVKYRSNITDKLQINPNSTVIYSKNHTLITTTSTTEKDLEGNNDRITQHPHFRSSTNTNIPGSVEITVPYLTATVATFTTTTSKTSSITSSTYVQVTPATTYQRRDLKPPKTAKFRICCGYVGGVGNHMFQFASTFGIAAKKGMRMILGKTNILTQIFEINDVEFVDDYSTCNKFGARGEGLASGFDQKLSNFENNTNVRLVGYLQSWKYFFDSVDELRKQFIFKKNIKDKVKVIINSILSKYKIKSRLDVTLVGVHIRRGDMVNNKYGYNVASKEYLTKAINYFESKNFTNLIFIVCSNDLSWSKSNMPSGVTTEYITGNAAEVDLAVLGSCNHSVSTVGSFSWWSSWLANGETTYYKWPAKEGSNLRRQYSKTYVDYFYPHWIGF